MSIILHNPKRNTFVGNLDHAELRDAKPDHPHGFRDMNVTTVDHLQTGELYRRDHAKRVPHSITILSGERSEPLPDVILKCTDVANALRLGHLRIEKQWEDAKEEKPKPSPEKPVAEEDVVPEPPAPAPATSPGPAPSAPATEVAAADSAAADTTTTKKNRNR